ncbi:MAG TPA: hypothetical protein VF789_26730 [Thermoanaerobaculia bacterium]
MADKDQIRKDEENVKHNEASEVTELDDQSLDEASGGSEFRDQEALADGNNNCLC